MKQGRERRKAQRLDANLFLKIFSPADKTDLGRGVVVDVSVTGLAFESEADLSQNQEVECVLEIPFRVRATVVRRVMKGQVKQYGVRIKDHSLLDRWLFKRAIKSGRRTLRV